MNENLFKNELEVNMLICPCYLMILLHFVFHLGDYNRFIECKNVYSILL